MEIPALPTTFEILGPVSFCFIQNLPSLSQPITVNSQLYPSSSSQLHTPLYLPSTIPLVFQSSLYCLHSVINFIGLFSLKFLRLHFLTQSPYLSHSQLTLSALSTPFDCPTLGFFPRLMLSFFSTPLLNRQSVTDYQYTS
jgi:hypothetical protein